MTSAFIAVIAITAFEVQKELSSGAKGFAEPRE